MTASTGHAGPPEGGRPSADLTPAPCTCAARRMLARESYPGGITLEALNQMAPPCPHHAEVPELQFTEQGYEQVSAAYAEAWAALRTARAVLEAAEQAETDASRALARHEIYPGIPRWDRCRQCLTGPRGWPPAAGHDGPHVPEGGQA